MTPRYAVLDIAPALPREGEPWHVGSPTGMQVLGLCETYAEVWELLHRSSRSTRQQLRIARLDDPRVEAPDA